MRQADLEKQMTEIGRQRYRAVAANADKHKYASRVGPGIALTKEAIHSLNKAIKDWYAQVNGKAGRNASSLYEVESFREDDGNFMALSALVCRVVLDQIVHKRKYASASAQIGQAASDEYVLQAVRARNPKLFSQVQKRERSNPRRAVQIMFDYGRRNEWLEDSWDRKTCIQFGALMLDLLNEYTGIIQIAHETTVARGQIRKNRYIQPTEETLEYLRQSHEHAEVLRPFWMPCVEQPRPWTSLWEGGYHNLEVIQKPAVRSRNRDYLNHMEDAALEPVFDCMNTLQSVPWQINEDVYEVISHLYETEVSVPGLPEVDGPAPPKALEDDPIEVRRDKARAGQMHRDQIRSNASRRVYIAKTLFTARTMKQVDRFYFPWFADFRGRLYSHVSYMSPQGDDVARSLLLFREGKPITTEAGLNWFYITGANLAGHDKLSLEDRIAWVDDHEEQILEVSEDPLDCMWWAEQDEPFQFLAWCLEFGRYHHDPNAEIRLPCHVDGSCNGLAIYSLLLRDEVGAEATNCGDLEDRQDIYLQVAAEASRLMQEDDADRARAWLDYFGGELPRSLVKRPVMITPYSGTRHSAQDYIVAEYTAYAKKNGKPPFVTGDGVPFTDLVWITGKVWAAIGQVISSSRHAMAWLRQVADLHTQSHLPVRWTSPSGFPCYMHTKPTKDCEVQLASRGRVRVMYRQEIEGFDKRGQADGVAPNVIHSFDAACLHLVCARARAEGIDALSVIHDSFAGLPDDVPAMVRIVKQTYYEVFSGNLLADLEAEFRQYLPTTASIPSAPKQGGFNIKRLLQSRYFVS